MVQGINKGGIDRNNINSTGQNISTNVPDSVQQLPPTSQEPQIELIAEGSASEKEGSAIANIDSYLHAYIAQLVSDEFREHSMRMQFLFVCSVHCVFIFVADVGQLNCFLLFPFFCEVN